MTPFDQRIREAQPDLSPSFLRLADFLLDSYAEAALLTATELAHRLDIDPATVVRFAQRLGYPGYPDLRREIRQKVKRELFVEHKVDQGTNAEIAEAAMLEVARNLELTRRGFDIHTAEQIIDTLNGRQRVILLSEGLALGPAQSLALWLEAAGYAIRLPQGDIVEFARAVAGIDPQDIVIALAITEETPFLSRAVAEAHKAGACTVAFVAAPSATVARHADFILAAHASSHPGLGQILVEALVFTFTRLLCRIHPEKYEHVSHKVEILTKRLVMGAE